MNFAKVKRLHLFSQSWRSFKKGAMSVKEMTEILSNATDLPELSQLTSNSLELDDDF